MIAVVRTFTKYPSLRKYIDVCSYLIINGRGAEVPLCMIRNYFNHIMYLISTWPEIKSSTLRIKNFYMRSIGLIIVNENFADVKYLLELIFTVSLHETDGNNYNNEPTQCETAKQYLKKQITTHSIDFEPLFSNEKNHKQ
jgi:predicted transcriptional regulator YheO